jgi:hypothetical protein
LPLFPVISLFFPSLGEFIERRLGVNVEPLDHRLPTHHRDYDSSRIDAATDASAFRVDLFHPESGK